MTEEAPREIAALCAATNDPKLRSKRCVAEGIADHGIGPLMEAIVEPE
jgi:hypothetical protein